MGTEGKGHKCSPHICYRDYSQRRLAHHEQHSAPRVYISACAFPGAIRRSTSRHVSKGFPDDGPPSACPVDAEPALSRIRATTVVATGHPDEHVLVDESRVQHFHCEPRDVRQAKVSRRETQAHPPTTASQRVKERRDGGFDRRKCPKRVYGDGDGHDV